MADGSDKRFRRPLGQIALREDLKLPVPPPAVASYQIPGARRTERLHDGSVHELYPPGYSPDGSPLAHLKFALRHEPLDLGVFVAALGSLDPRELTDWVRREPTGAFSRRAWFLYEHFTSRTLDLEDTRRGNYVEALDPRRHFVGDRRRSARHRVVDNLLGGPGLCPTVRRTARLEARIASNLAEEARRLAAPHRPETLARAVSYMYSKETRSSFALEGEVPGARRAERFIASLRNAPAFDPFEKAELVRLHATIVDPRYAADDYRTRQNFVGGATADYGDRVDFISPKPEDVPELMTAWMETTRRLLTGAVDPVVAAAVSSFAFVFLHPFDDGNGRIHRFLLHAILARREFSPPGMIFPVSVAILRDRRGYDEVLEAFSRPLFSWIDWHFTAGSELVVDNETAYLYRYFDATRQAEYLYDRIADTVHRDLRDELEFLEVYDRAMAAVLAVVDMPDRRASLLVRSLLSHEGRLPRRRRGEWSEIGDGELAELEAAVQAVLE
jgi:hypothetical protein